MLVVLLVGSMSYFQRSNVNVDPTLMSSSSSFSARSCPWRLRGQQLKIEPPHITVRHYC